MTWPYWLAIGAAGFALGALVDERIGEPFDRLIALLVGAPILVVLWIWDAVNPSPQRSA